MTANERRQKVVAQYKTILGRNRYSQPLRDYCFKQYRDGKYYSDCSSSISYAYKQAGESFGVLNTVGMYNCEKFKAVAVVIKNGVIQNPDVLRVGDMLLFAGADSSRKGAGYVGHVEMVYSISGGVVTLCGHGSGTPRVTGLNTYCRSRYAKKTKTALGHRGLIKVVRYIQDDAVGENDANAKDISTSAKRVSVNGNTVRLREGPGTQFDAVTLVGAGSKSKVTELEAVDAGNWRPVLYKGRVLWISKDYISEVQK